MIYRREARTGGQFVFESFDLMRGTFRQYLNTTIIEVLYIADDLMPRGSALRKEPITHGLHFATDKKPTRNWRHIRHIEFNTSKRGVQSEDRESGETFFLPSP